jgi:hypothetical protein
MTIVINVLFLGQAFCMLMLFVIIAILDDKLYDGEFLGIIKEWREEAKKNNEELPGEKSDVAH